jgi:acyl carrier protein phosphodiesterase
MNYLAHAYLSFNQPEILVGNLISDFVKGKTKFTYTTGIQDGIKLHREIDNFTDNHPATKEAKKIFSPVYRLYSGAFIDVVYDHFLANDINEFPEENFLLSCTHQAYTILEIHQKILPEKFAKMLPFMRQQNWLYNYKYTWGIKKSFEGLVKRAAYLNESEIAFSTFEKEYTQLKIFYDTFFPELKKFVLNWQGINEIS